ncbi:MAG: GntR family transcriptional regulator [Geminicoccaceae bacterium]
MLNSTYAAGDKLPKDEHLAEELGCSRATIQRAMRDLAESGAVERRRKCGTCVRRDPVIRATQVIPITQLEVEQRGAVYSYQFIRKAIMPPPVAVASRLGLPGQAPLLRIEALHLADHRHYIYEDRWICQATVPEIEEVDLNTESANEWLVRNNPFSQLIDQAARARLGFVAIRFASPPAWPFWRRPRSVYVFLGSPRPCGPHGSLICARV